MDGRRGGGHTVNVLAWDSNTGRLQWKLRPSYIGCTHSLCSVAAHLIKDFLNNRPQQVIMHPSTSSIIILEWCPSGLCSVRPKHSYYRGQYNYCVGGQQWCRRTTQEGGPTDLNTAFHPGLKKLLQEPPPTSPATPTLTPYCLCSEDHGWLSLTSIDFQSLLMLCVH